MDLLFANFQDLHQGSSLLYSSPFDPRLRRPPPHPKDLLVAVEDLLDLAVEIVLQDGLRLPVLAGFMKARVEDHLGGTPSLALPIPLELAVALSVPARTDSVLSSNFDPRVPHCCSECAREIEREELHLLDHSVKENQIICMPCVKVEGAVAEPIEESEEAALLCIQRRLIELGHLA